MPGTLRLAVAQTTVPEDPADAGALRESGAQIRSLMRDAHASGATLAQFPEGAVVYPGKRVVSSAGPAVLAEADWTRADWDVMRTEAEAIARLAAQLGLWTVLGSLHPLTPPRRPHNSLYVIAPDGAVVTRYDKRFLSNTEVSWMYTPGTEPGLFEAEGLRFGCALCIEVHFPEIFAEYERLDVDCVLISVMVDDQVRPVIAQAYAALHNYWVGYSTPAQYSRSIPAGIVAPGGRWIARCPANGQPAITVADLDSGRNPDIDGAVRFARPWCRAARSGLYDAHLAPDDPRSRNRTSF
ncbi:MAG TPA: carbon-nitrogen hydrolase family protein [Streptosporangiaceae bacterium]